MAAETIAICCNHALPLCSPSLSHRKSQASPGKGIVDIPVDERIGQAGVEVLPKKKHQQQNETNPSLACRNLQCILTCNQLGVNIRQCMKCWSNNSGILMHQRNGHMIKHTPNIRRHEEDRTVAISHINHISDLRYNPNPSVPCPTKPNMRTQAVWENMRPKSSSCKSEGIMLTHLHVPVSAPPS